jgi:uncharacterized protein (DUF362 family)
MADDERTTGELDINRALREASAEDNATTSRPSRRDFVGGAAAVALAATTVAATTVIARSSQAAEGVATASLSASPPPGFTPLSAPGRVVKVSKAGSLQENQIYPKPDDAKLMLTRVLTELTGKADLPTALAQFIHKDDKVVVKVNGIALRNMSTNKEFVLPLLDGLIEMGVPPSSITVLEQYGSFLGGTRVSQQNVPQGVKVAVHGNDNATMDYRMVPGTGVKTKFVRYLTEATAAINIALIKDHSICGYTGALKNMTHGCSINPHDFHVHHASPQIAVMYAQDVIKSRVRLCLTDAFKVMAHGGPLDKQPQYRFPYEAVFASTDPVAMDTIGWEIVEEFRAKKGLKTLTAEGRAPAYIMAAADLGLGIADRAQIQLKEVAL